MKRIASLFSMVTRPHAEMQVRLTPADPEEA